MSIKMAFTKLGVILGDFNEVESDTDTDLFTVYTVKNPMILNVTPQGLGVSPMLMFAEEDYVRLTQEDLHCNGQLFEPKTELKNHYNSQFGAGIQVVPAGAMPKSPILGA